MWREGQILAFAEGLLHTRPHAEPERKAEEILYPPLRTHVSSKAEDWLTAPMTSQTVKGQCPQAARQPAAHLAGPLREWSLSPNARSCCHLHLDCPIPPSRAAPLPVAPRAPIPWDKEITLPSSSLILGLSSPSSPAGTPFTHLMTGLQKLIQVGSPVYFHYHSSAKCFMATISFDPHNNSQKESNFAKEETKP